MSKQPPNDAGQALSAAGDAKRRPPSLVVGIGASAGGLAAFKSFFDNMPADTGMAFVLVQHLDPAHQSMLTELLRPHTEMPIEEARDRVVLEANRVFVIPPNATLTMEGDVLRVTTPAPRVNIGARSTRCSPRSPKIRRTVRWALCCRASAATAPPA